MPSTAAGFVAGQISVAVAFLSPSDSVSGSIDAPLMVGNTLDDAVNFQLAIGPAGEVYREAGDEALAKHDEIIAALTSELSKHVTDDGVFMESSSWKIRARNPF